MTNIRSKQRAAIQTAEARGHVMRRWHENTLASGKRELSAECRLCSAYVVVRPDPAPNEVEVGGTAVATDCK